MGLWDDLINEAKYAYKKADEGLEYIKSVSPIPLGGSGPQGLNIDSGQAERDAQKAREVEQQRVAAAAEAKRQVEARQQEAAKQAAARPNPPLAANKPTEVAKNQIAVDHGERISKWVPTPGEISEEQRQKNEMKKPDYGNYSVTYGPVTTSFMKDRYDHWYISASLGLGKGWPIGASATAGNAMIVDPTYGVMRRPDYINENDLKSTLIGPSMNFSLACLVGGGFTSPIPLVSESEYRLVDVGYYTPTVGGSVGYTVAVDDIVETVSNNLPKGLKNMNIEFNSEFNC